MIADFSVFISRLFLTFLMPKYLLLSLVLLFAINGSTQKVNVDSMQLEGIGVHSIDSLEQLLTTKKDDTSKANLLGRLSYDYAFNDAEKGIHYGEKGVQLSQKLRYTKGVAYCTQSIAMSFWLLGNYGNALQSGIKALHLYEQLKDEERMAWTYYILADIYRDFGDYKRALVDARKGTGIYESMNASGIVGYGIIGSIYDLQNKSDSALLYVQKARQLDLKDNRGQWGWLYYLLGNIHRKKKQYDVALTYYRTALPLVNKKDIIETYNGLAILYRETGREDSTIFYATEVLQNWGSVSYQRGILQSVNILSEAYKKRNQRDSTIKYLELSIELNNKLFNQEKERDIQNLAFNEQLRQDEIARQSQQYRNQLKMYGLLALGILFLAIAILLWRNNQQRQKAYVFLQKQKEETDRQKSKAEQTLEELKATQSQLVQREKMASLGELTAGIAHEIQNPLNFVNNFSEVNKELLMEMKDEMDKGNIRDANAIANDVIDNEEKINQHGKRADAIVKGMLQHSRTSSGQKELTDLNALCDEYLRLAYHGFRAKEKTFNAKFETDLDKTIEKINVVPQDIGRVILNLINNAFYAVNEKRHQMDGACDPIVSISTKKLDARPPARAGTDGDDPRLNDSVGQAVGRGKVEIRVKDNGNGIPQKVLDKIFQPFFTTKPTGQGTGLGLSLSYDIIKAHGGELKVETKEGEGSEFIIQLPFA
jgi:two-component system NtrC family sensor kinase